jgi:hypothetical protein
MTKIDHEPDGCCGHCGYDLLLYLNRKLVCVRCGALARADRPQKARPQPSEAAALSSPSR